MEMSLKSFILNHKILYELYFLLSGKKINRKKLDKQIRNLNKSFTENNEIKDLIISLTTYGERLKEVQYTLLSLIRQSIKPEKIIVWLANDEIVPNELSVFKQFRVEFKYCKDIKSYKKLIPALNLYSEKCIVTADDDIFYKKNWLKKLWVCHLKNPDSKITHIAHRVSFTDSKELKPYTKWIHDLNSAPKGKNIFPTGAGGILYPPHAISIDFLNEDLMMSLCPKADDVWFYFMGILSEQDTIIVPHPYNHLRYIDIYKEYGLNSKETLQSINVEQNYNDVQIRKVMAHFGLNNESLYQLLNNNK